MLIRILRKLVNLPAKAMIETMLYTVEYATIFAVLEYKSNVFLVDFGLSVADPFVQLKLCKVMLKCDAVVMLVVLGQVMLLIFEND